MVINFQHNIRQDFNGNGVDNKHEVLFTQPLLKMWAIYECETTLGCGWLC